MRAIRKQIISKTLNYLLKFGLIIIVVVSQGCKKFLDEKPRVSDVVPAKLSELQSLLDNTIVMNSNSAYAFAEIVADNYFVVPNEFNSMRNSSNRFLQQDAQHHVWEAQAQPGEYYWKNVYQPIYFSNLVLDQLPLLPDYDETDAKFRELRGAALFYRAFAFYSIAQLFCRPYADEYLSMDGIVLRTTANVGETFNRASVKETYDKIIADLEEAIDLLPENVPFLTRPSKTAANAILARIYLSMRNYAKAEEYANKTLQRQNALINYNTLLPPGFPSVPAMNAEVIFHSFSPFFEILGPARSRIEPSLFNSYDNNDLRKRVFYLEAFGPGLALFRGSYRGKYGATSIFDGLSTNEMYLIRAECAARAGRKEDAITDLNTLMLNRWSNNGSWTPFAASDAAEALTKILVERRKELVWRGIRWSDIRRFNLEGANITLTRNISGTTYTLPPNDPRSVMLIPWEEISRSGIEQNAR